MHSLHIENTVHDFDEWKAVFDRFSRFRAEKRVRAYRVARRIEDPTQVVLDLEFDSIEDASAFRGALLQIWRTPQSERQLVSHTAPQLYEVVEESGPGTVSAAAASTA